MISALSPLDGRYASKTAMLCPFFSEEALTRYRVIVELSYFEALANESGITDLPPLKATQLKALDAIIENFDAAEAKKIKAIEKKTNHDVKAVEYYLKEKMKQIPGLKDKTEFIHFSLTSEDVNNLAYGMMIHDAVECVIHPYIKDLAKAFASQGRKWQKVSLLSLTHGQPATPTTLGKEMMVFADRLTRQLQQLKAFTMQGKFGGAVANYSAHTAAYPKVKWETFGKRFVKSLGLDYMPNATQINPHDDIAELSHIMCRVNTMLIDYSRDMWLYIMRGVFKQKVIAGEVGSSTMPHKVNPIDFENAEGNCGLSNALFGHFAAKLPISRLQRDLSDSTVQRNIGSAFGYFLIAMASLEKGMSKVTLNKKVVQQELANHPEVLAEAIQTVLRKNKVDGAYEKLKELTRGEAITLAEVKTFVEALDLPKAEIERLKKICKL